MTHHDDSFFTDDLNAKELVERLIDDERKRPTVPRSSEISVLVLEW